MRRRRWRRSPGVLSGEMALFPGGAPRRRFPISRAVGITNTRIIRRTACVLASSHPVKADGTAKSRAARITPRGLLFSVRVWVSSSCLEDDLQKSVEQFAQRDHGEDKRRHGREGRSQRVAALCPCRRARASYLSPPRSCCSDRPATGCPRCPPAARPPALRRAAIFDRTRARNAGRVRRIQAGPCAWSCQVRCEHQQRSQREEKHHHQPSR